MKAIIVKYLGPTDTKGSRWKASCDGGSCTVPYDHALNCDENATAAAVALCQRMKWHGSTIIGPGRGPNGDYVFVFADEPRTLVP